MADAAVAMNSAARALTSALTEPQRDAMVHPFDDAARTQWTYLPRPRPGISLLGLGETARKAAHRLLAAALSRHAFAQAVTIMALEEILDLDENGRRGRHSDDYRVAVFGSPGGEMWVWRFEGHHLSVTAAVAGRKVVVAPLFLGADPARIAYQEQTVVGPLRLEEELARALLVEMGTTLRDRAVVADTAPADIRTGTSPHVNTTLEPAGVPAALLLPRARDLLRRLVDVYLDRLAPALAEHERRQLRLDDAAFAWEGGVRAVEGHYYRMQAPGLLIEYDNTQRDANHAHTVLRRPGEDFGAGLLAAHVSAERE
ncbi:MAG: DUF3500 domain-containing protein [Egibacteraceae bacterium]